MKLLAFAGAAAFAAGALAEDLLFFSGLTGDEITEAAALGYTTKTVNDAEWRAMTTADFAKYKAIVIGDQYCQVDTNQLNVFADTKDVWGPAVSGNIIVIGMKPARLPQLQIRC